MDAGNEQDRLVSHGGFTPDPGSPDSLAGSMIKNPPANAEDTGDVCSTPGSGRSPGVGDGNPVFLPGKFHGQRSLVGYSP